jgi:hypothetical protein
MAKTRPKWKGSSWGKSGTWSRGLSDSAPAGARRRVVQLRPRVARTEAASSSAGPASTAKGKKKRRFGKPRGIRAPEGLRAVRKRTRKFLRTTDKPVPDDTASGLVPGKDSEKRSEYYKRHLRERQLESLGLPADLPEDELQKCSAFRRGKVRLYSNSLLREAKDRDESLWDIEHERAAREQESLTELQARQAEFLLPPRRKKRRTEPTSSRERAASPASFSPRPDSPSREDLVEHRAREAALAAFSSAKEELEPTSIQIEVPGEPSGSCGSQQGNAEAKVEPEPQPKRLRPTSKARASSATPSARAAASRSAPRPRGSVAQTLGDTGLSTPVNSPRLSLTARERAAVRDRTARFAAAPSGRAEQVADRRSASRGPSSRLRGWSATPTAERPEESGWQLNYNPQDGF